MIINEDDPLAQTIHEMRMAAPTYPFRKAVPTTPLVRSEFRE